MSISVGVDAVTLNIARVVTSAAIAGVVGGCAFMAGEKYRIPNGPLWFLVAVAVVVAGLGAFFAGWASIKLSLLAGICMALGGGALALYGFTDKRAASLGGGIALLAAGTAWLAWILYLMFR